MKQTDPEAWLFYFDSGVEGITLEAIENLLF